LEERSSAANLCLWLRAGGGKKKKKKEKKKGGTGVLSRKTGKRRKTDTHSQIRKTPRDLLKAVLDQKPRGRGEKKENNAPMEAVGGREESQR